MAKLSQPIKFRYYFIGWTILLTGALLMPSSGSNPIAILDLPHLDKIVHVLAFAIFSLLLSLSIGKPGILIVFTVAALYGIIIETLQISIPGRSFETLDWVADIAGTFLGYLAFISLIKRKV